MNNITVILKYGKLIKIDFDLFICIYKDWTIKFISDENKDNKKIETYLYYKGIYLDVMMINENDVDLSGYDILPGIIEKENSTLL